MVAERVEGAQNGGMFVTAEIITTVVAVFGAAATILGGVAAMLAAQTKKLDARFERVDARFERVDAQLATLAQDLSDAKISIARLEGPLPRLHVGR